MLLMRDVARKMGRVGHWLPIDERWLAKLKLQMKMSLVRQDLEARCKGSVLRNLLLLLNHLLQLLILIVLHAKLSLKRFPLTNITCILWLFAIFALIFLRYKESFFSSGIVNIELSIIIHRHAYV